MDKSLTYPTLNWTCRDRCLHLGVRTHVMGILNCTPDSFSDGGRFLDRDAAVAHGLQMIADGADIIDVGGESTRPGSLPVPAEEEADRVVPVIAALRDQSNALISVDTRKSEVAAAACGAGAHIVNDVSACTDDPAILDVIRDEGVGVVLMHMRGQPATMQDQPVYDDVVGFVSGYLADRVAAAEERGIPADRVVLDPGIGFGKTLDHNLDLIAAINILRQLGRPILMGVSRKRFLQALTGRPVEERMAGSLAAHALCIVRGADILRVHDVKETCDVIAIADMLKARWDFLNT